MRKNRRKEGITMAKRVRYAILRQDGKEIVVQIKTCTEKFMNKLIADYKRIGKLNGGKVEWEVI